MDVPIKNPSHSAGFVQVSFGKFQVRAGMRWKKTRRLVRHHCIRFPRKMSYEKSNRLAKALRRELKQAPSPDERPIETLLTQPYQIRGCSGNRDACSSRSKSTGVDKTLQSFIGKTVKRWKTKHAKPKRGKKN